MGADWASPVVVVDKKEPGARRMCMDQRAINGITKGDAYPMPTVGSMLEGLEGTKVMRTLDIHIGFHQIRMDPRDKDKTAFITKQGRFRFTRMPFGLKNASATFLRVMYEILDGLEFAKVYVDDDILVSSPDYETHLRHLDIVLLSRQMPTCESRPRSAASPDLRFRTWDTCGRQRELKPDPAKLEAIRAIQQPNDVREVRAYLGVTGYYRKVCGGICPQGNAID
jgi:putative transposase